MRILSEHDVERLIEPEAAIAAMADAFRRHSSGRMPAPGRLDMGRASPKGSVLVLAGHSDEQRRMDRVHHLGQLAHTIRQLVELRLRQRRKAPCRHHSTVDVGVANPG